ncbi:MAG: terminase large subunit, partial [Comamonadaceae bacterium]
GAHPVLTMCAANATVTKDPTGARKLDKSRSTGRIDGMQAMAMAIGAACRAEAAMGVSLEGFTFV